MLFGLFFMETKVEKRGQADVITVATLFGVFIFVVSLIAMAYFTITTKDTVVLISQRNDYVLRMHTDEEKYFINGEIMTVYTYTLGTVINGNNLDNNEIYIEDETLTVILSNKTFYVVGGNVFVFTGKNQDYPTIIYGTMTFKKR
jgi:preprotein translocase subunit SecG